MTRWCRCSPSCSSFSTSPSHQLGDRNARPAADHLGDVLFVNLFLEQTRSRLVSAPAALLRLAAAFQIRQLAVAELRGFVQIVLRVPPARSRRLSAQSLHESCATDLRPVFPPATARAGVELAPSDRPAPSRVFASRSFEARSFSFFERLALNLQLHHAPLSFIQFGGHRIDLRAQPGRGFVDEIDGFVRQKTIGDVAVATARRPRPARNP